MLVTDLFLVASQPSYIIQDYLPWGSNHPGLGPPPSVTNQENNPQANLIEAPSSLMTSPAVSA